RIIGSTGQGGVMTIKVRRVVTGHDGNGRAVVKIDEVSKNIVSNRPGASACVVWTTDTIPADNSGDSDASTKKVGTTLPGGTVFRVIEFSPGVAPRVHRTDSIDYAVVISGEIDMELEKGSEVHLKAGDVLVQRGTVHCWINRVKVACVMAFVLDLDPQRPSEQRRADIGVHRDGYLHDFLRIEEFLERGEGRVVDVAAGGLVDVGQERALPVVEQGTRTPVADGLDLLRRVAA